MSAIFSGLAMQMVVYNDYDETRARKGCRSLLWVGGLAEQWLTWCHEHYTKLNFEIDSNYWPSAPGVCGDPTAFNSPIDNLNGAWEIDHSPVASGHIWTYFIRGQAFLSDG